MSQVELWNLVFPNALPRVQSIFTNFYLGAKSIGVAVAGPNLRDVRSVTCVPRGAKMPKNQEVCSEVHKMEGSGLAVV